MVKIWSPASTLRQKSPIGTAGDTSGQTMQNRSVNKNSYKNKSIMSKNRYL